MCQMSPTLHQLSQYGQCKLQYLISSLDSELESKIASNELIIANFQGNEHLCSLRHVVEHNGLSQ